MEMIKKCPRCQITKHRDDFYRSKRTNSGLQVYCKQCNSELDKNKREWRKEHGPTIQRDSKICARCQSQKPKSQFGRRTDSPDGMMSYCKPCWVKITTLAQLRTRTT